MQIEERVTVCEMQVQCLRRRYAWAVGILSVGVVMLCGVTVWMALRTQYQDLAAQSFSLIDSQGRERAAWRIDDTGAAAVLAFFGASGEPRVVVGNHRDRGPEFALLDKNGVLRVWVRLEEEKPRVSVMDAAAREVGGFVVRKGIATLYLKKADGETTWLASPVKCLEPDTTR